MHTASPAVSLIDWAKFEFHRWNLWILCQAQRIPSVGLKSPIEQPKRWSLRKSCCWDWSSWLITIAREWRRPSCRARTLPGRSRRKCSWRHKTTERSTWWGRSRVWWTHNNGTTRTRYAKMPPAYWRTLQLSTIPPVTTRPSKIHC